MTAKKKLIKKAKALFKASLKNNLIDEVKVRKILKLVASQKRAESLKVLKIYKRLIEQKEAQEKLIIETPTPMAKTDFVRQLVAKTGAKRIIHKTNPKMIFGAKITSGDWIYDLTLDSQLKQITQRE